MMSATTLNFHIVKFPFLDGYLPHRASYGVYISQLMRFARVMLRTSTLEINVYRPNFSNRIIGIINFEKHFLNFNLDTMN